MIRAFLFLFVLTIRTFAGEADWPHVKFSEVRAYAWPNEPDTKAVILEGMALKSDVLNPEGAILSAEQARTLIRAITGEHRDYPGAMCYVPHNAFVFYDAANTPVAFVELCFGCSGHRTSPAGAAGSIDLVALAAIFDAHKLPMGEYADLAAYKKHFEKLQKIMKEFEEAK